MLKYSAIIGTVLAGVITAGALEMPDEVKHFSREIRKRLPGAAKYEPAADGTCTIRDENGKIVGTLYLERISDDDRQMGYAGTIEIAVVFDPAGKVAGVLLGRNQETPSFLNRVRAAKFLDQWNGLRMEEILDKQVDTVTGATYSSSAIRAGVRKLAESYLAEGKRSEEEETGLTAEERAAVERELVQLERKVQMHRRIWESSERLLKQLRERKEEELELRFIAAVDGKEAAAEFAKKHDMMFFNHPRRGPEKKSRTELLGEAYRSSRSAEDLAKLKAAILEDYEGLLLRVPPHNEEHLKAMKASQERVELLKKKLGYADQTGSPAITE